MGELSRYRFSVTAMQPLLQPQQLQQVPLTSAPERLTVWKASTPWRTVRSMLGLVIVCYFISQIAVLIVAGYIDGDLNGTIGPFDPLFTFLGGICLSPFLMLFFYLRRPSLTHTVQAYPSAEGRQLHALAGGAVVKSPEPTVVQHHLFRSTAPLEMPRPFHLWMLFIFGVGISTLCLLPLTVYGANAFTLLLAVMVVLPAWLIGFSTPVFAWWSITSRHMGIHISRRDAEWVLAAGMLSTVPAIVINSVLSPILVSFAGFDATASGTLGEGFILFLSAPIGEELSKALAVLALSHLIISPKHGFYVGSTVGLGFALLENATYISMALASDYSSIAYFFTATLRGLSSIPGHAMWTGLTGYAIGCWLARGHRLPSLSGTAYLSEQTDANWVLYDKEGRAIPNTSWATMPSDRMIRLLSRHQKHAWPMPQTLSTGLLLAILGHALWNGSSWGVGMLLADSESLFAVLLQLMWLAVMVLTLWFCILRWLPTIVLKAQE
ncbi:MAG: PrsW family glutamic-type intramembrane protease [Poseidonia sp.]